MESLILGEQYNIGHICTQQQVAMGKGDRVAMRWIAPNQESRDFTFKDLDLASNRFANVLEGLGLQAGETLFTYLPKTPELFFAVLGSLKKQVITGTLFSNFGEEALLDRLGDAGAACVLTRKGLYRKIRKIKADLPRLKYAILIDIDEHESDSVLSYSKLMREASEQFQAPPTAPSTPSMLHYTSGSTGKPKGVVHGHGSILHQAATTRDVFQLQEDDIYWCTADPGWVTGVSYGIFGPWSLGITQVHYGGPYDAAAWFELLEKERISVWYTAPTALRMLMREEPSIYAGAELGRLRSIFSVGEALNPEVIHWAKRELGHDIYDTWFQTETGGVMISNRPGLEIRPGSMGRPVPGIQAAILAEDGTPVPDGESGNLCVKAGWPSMFRTYLNNPEVYAKKFVGDYYFSGDTAFRDAEGYFWFQGRSDDVINTAGHLISPFEIESALLEIPEVFESGVIGAPDELLYEKVVAFVRLRQGIEWSPELELKIRLHISQRVSTIATPQDIVVLDSIPKNKSGKIMRRVMKARYLGKDAGDTSTMESEL